MSKRSHALYAPTLSTLLYFYFEVGVGVSAAVGVGVEVGVGIVSAGLVSSCLSGPEVFGSSIGGETFAAGGVATFSCP